MFRSSSYGEYLKKRKISFPPFSISFRFANMSYSLVHKISHSFNLIELTGNFLSSNNLYNFILMREEWNRLLQSVRDKSSSSNRISLHKVMFYLSAFLLLLSSRIREKKKKERTRMRAEEALSLLNELIRGCHLFYSCHLHTIE